MGKLISFKEYVCIQEAKIPDTIQQKYGKILFGTTRKLPETDTEFEAWQWQKIFRFFKSYQNKADAIFKDLLKLKKYYPVLEGSTQKTLYRGVGFGYDDDENRFKAFSITKQILKHLKSGMYDDDKGVRKWRGDWSYEWVELNKLYMYHPKNVAESWTTKESSANMSVSNSAGYLLMGIVPLAERIFKGEVSDKLKDGAGLQLPKEWEVVRVSKKPLKVKIQMHKETFDNLKKMV